MPLFAQHPIPGVFWGIISLVLLGFLVSWFFFVNQLREGKPILPRYQPRRPVPWTGLDLLLIVIFYFSVGSCIQYLPIFAGKVSGKPEPERRQKIERKTESAGDLTANSPKKAKETTAHPLAQLLKNKNPLIVVLCFSVGVVIVPIFEEVFFRLLFTGWLLSAERPWRRKWGKFYGPRGVLPIHLSSLVFAALHFRMESPELKETNLIFSMGILGATSLLTLIFALALVSYRDRASLRDLGWDAEKWKEDTLSGAIAFFAVAPPIYAVQIALSLLLPKEIAPDPIALYFFAIVLGLLYFRTNRILSSIVMHMLLNAGSLALAWATM